jgi:hypothetical protein
MTTLTSGVSAYTESSIVRGAEAATSRLTPGFSVYVVKFSLQDRPARDLDVSDAELAAENAEWRALFERKTEAIDKIVADVKAQRARGETRPLDLNEL